MSATEQPSHVAEHPKPTKLKALGMLIGAMVMSFGFIALCAVVKNQEFYAGFLFLLCWSVMEKMQLARLPHAIIGSAFGVLLGFALQYLLANSVPMGGITFTAIVMIVLYCQFLGWLPLIANLSTFTFLLVLTASHIQAHGDFGKVAISLALGIAYFTPILMAAIYFSNKKKVASS